MGPVDSEQMGCNRWTKRQAVSPNTKNTQVILVLGFGRQEPLEYEITTFLYPCNGVSAYRTTIFQQIRLTHMQ